MGQRLFKPKHASSPGRTFNPNKARDAMYDTQWEKYRAKYLAINSRCYSCGEQATVVDHLKPHQGDEKLFKQLNNHIPLCKRCHDTVTAKFDRRYRQGNSIEPKIKWLTSQRLLKELTFRVKVLPEYE